MLEKTFQSDQNFADGQPIEKGIRLVHAESV